MSDERAKRREAIDGAKSGTATIKRMSAEQQDQLVSLLHEQLTHLVSMALDLQAAIGLLSDLRQRDRGRA